MAFEDHVTLLCLLISFFICSCKSVFSDGPYFDKFPFRKFELGSVIQTISVEVADIQCVMDCLRLPECLSLNIAEQPNQDGLFECILLREGMCATPKCRNGGTCLTLVNDYRCHCRQRFAGKHCETDLACNASSALGMEDGRIPDQQLSASSVYSGSWRPAYGRLHFKANSSHNQGAWSPKTKDVNQWFQVDLGTVAKVKGVATQGAPISAEWVTSYSLQYSTDNSTYADYEQGKNFTGNSDHNTVVKNDVKPAII